MSDANVNNLGHESVNSSGKMEATHGTAEPRSPAVIINIDVGMVNAAFEAYLEMPTAGMPLPNSDNNEIEVS